MVPVRISLSRKILILYVVTSLLVATFTSIIQITLEYRSGQDEQQKEIESFKYMSLPSLENFLWTLNIGTLEDQLKALLATKDLVKVQVFDEQGNTMHMEVKPGDWQSFNRQRFELFNPNQRQERIGSVELVYTQDFIAADMERVSLLIILTNLALTFVAAFVLVYLLNKNLLKRFERFNVHLAHQDWRDPKPYIPEKYGWPFGHTEDEFTEVEKGYSAASEQIRSVTSQLESAARSSSRMAELGTLSAGIAHEINNPLTIISAYATKVAGSNTKPMTEAQLVACGEAILKATGRISKIVRGLKYFSSGREDQKIEYILIRDLMTEISPFFETTLAQKGVALKVEVEDENLAIVGQSVQLSQVLLNLINNAVDAIESKPEKWIHIQFSRGEDGFIVCTFTDSGHGIPAEVQPNIFVPFFTTKSIGKGTGLGLSIVHGIIRKHGGDIKLNTKSLNTQFIITLPTQVGGPRVD